MKDLVPKQQALKNVESSATLIHTIIVGQYGDEVYDWDPATVYLELRDDFRVEPASEVMDKWNAMQVVMTSDGFFKRLDAFMGICNTLATGQPFFTMFDPVTVEEASWAVTEVALNRELLPFSYAIKQYLRQLLTESGFSESDYPSALAEVFDVKPASADIRAGLAPNMDEGEAAMMNKENIDIYITGELADMVSQFNKIPSMNKLDDLIIRRGLNEFTGNQENEDE